MTMSTSDIAVSMTDLVGQWIGRISGNINGTLTLNFDSDRVQYGLILVAIDGETNIGFVGRFFCHFNHERFQFWTNEIAPTVSGGIRSEIPNSINAHGICSNGCFSGTWTSENNKSGEFTVSHQDESEPTSASVIFDSWDNFQQWMRERRKFESRYIYRGHERSTYRLESTFHCAGRRNIARYSSEDIPELYRVLAPLLTHRFDLNNPVDFLAFLFLARHHGYPTPLLDWSESHYVAAFFAFFRGEIPASPPEYVRILEFDPDNYDRVLDKKFKLATILEPAPKLEIVGAIPFGNPRAIPQQSKVMFSNVANAERFILGLEKLGLENNEQYVILNKIDLKYSMRDDVMAYLRYIGITPATMFPGLDGACRALAQKYFNR